MTIRFIGIKELRQNMAKISESIRKKNERLVVLRRNKPIFELRPISKDEVGLERLLRDIEEAQKDVRTGKTYTLTETRKRLGLT